MGIPGLLQKLSPYAETTYYCRSAETERQVVIDGPALAYHVLSLCKAKRFGTSRVPLEALPGWRELADATILWLEELESCGFRVRRIFFDGYLPSTKLPERQGRIEQMIASHAFLQARSLDEGLGCMPPHREPDHDIMATASTPGSGKAIAPMCFVSAVVDGIRRSRLHASVEVVPSEADLYCARLAKDQEVYVLTNDSDLLVHDIGPYAKVVFLKDIVVGREQDWFLSFLEFYPKSIAERLGIPDLLTLAFHAYQDKTRSVADIVLLSKKTAVPQREFHDFTIQYTSPERPLLLRSLEKSNAISDEAFCSGLDPRTLEIVLQLNPDRRDSASQLDIVNIFPPLPIDDIDRAWAYQPTQDLRILVYSLLRFISPALSQISESTRKDKSRSTSILHLLPPSTLSAKLSELTTWITSTLTFYAPLPRARQHRALAASVVLGSKRAQSKSLPTSDIVIPVVLNNALLPYTWALLHFKAEVQAALWTLHLAREILVVISRLWTVLEIDPAHEEVLHALGEALDGMPGLAEVFDWLDCTAGVAEDELSVVIEALTDLSAGDGGVKGGRKNKKKRKREKKDTKAMVQADGKGNVFDVLTKLDDDDGS